ncbi:MAG: rhomboid family intramembrane serine protease [Bacteroidales bacterium]
MSGFNFGRAGGTPPVVKNLIVINIIMFVAMLAFSQLFRIELNRILGMYYIGSPLFKPWQIVTHMFMHGGFMHILFNMWALWIFGKTLESVWGGKRFLIYYLVTGLGAVFFHQLVMYIELAPQIADFKATYNVDVLTVERLNHAMNSGSQFHGLIRGLVTPTVGASGAVFGILLAFGMLFPNTPLFIIPFPFPIKAKWLVIGYGALELYLGVTQPGSNIAHFAHLGGMVFGFILIKYWHKTNNKFY